MSAAPKDRFTLTLSLGEFFTVRSALERWLQTLDGYQTAKLTESQSKDVLKFKAETKRVLEAIAECRSAYLGAGHQ